ncbi:UNVERIFIED_CONTAM: hypothetical protein Slati_2240500 [Sesamum latifolium]|uniref:RNase H type-1 domain-containing protein n=1 Tax=Sesamum latifolium TaxID=2727402 RepID=A0AAW2WUS2_9LAMI
MEAIEEVKMIEFFGDPLKAVKIGSSLDPPFEHDLINFLQGHSDVYAWETSDMQGISPEVMVHKLNLHPEARPIKQKKRSFGTERNKIIKKEVEKLLKVNYIRPVQYPEWLENVVLVAKSNGKWRMCINFTDLNRACPKDSFPLPRIDAMIDSTSGCKLMSFFDAFRGCNQIRLAQKIKKKLVSSWNKERIITRKTLQGPEDRYPQIEKLALALVTATRKLRPYFQSHPVVVLTNHPLKKILADLNISGRMVKWSIELRKHGIEYQPRPAIKSQPIADFISELIGTDDPQKTEWWKIFVDGSSTSLGSGAGIVVEIPQGDILQYAIKFDFTTSNNEAEYEALIAWGKLALAAGAKHLKAHSDSQLVVNQIRGDYEAKGSKMTKYLSCIQTSMRKFDEFAIEQIPRSKNEEAAQLAKLASQDKVEYVLREIHEGSHGNYSEGRALASKALRTTPRRSTGESPFSLVYGTEVIVPVEIGEETLRVQQYEPTNNGLERQMDLDLIQELRNNENTRTTAYKAIMAKAYNSKVRRREFQVGDLVLRRADATKNLEKLDTKWEGGRTK